MNERMMRPENCGGGAEAQRSAVRNQKSGGAASVKLIRTKSRVYPSTAHKRARSGATSPAEYAVVSGKKILAHIILNGRKWIAVQRNGENKFGLPVSPYNITRLRDLKGWVIERFGG